MRSESKLSEQKYITFSLGDEDYGVPVTQVLEIVRMENLIRVPHSIDYFLGMMDVRGQVIPIVDLKKKLHMDFLTEKPERAILIETGGRKIGLAVDRVTHVKNFSTDTIDEGPPVLRGGSARHVLGVGKTGDQFIVLITLEGLFTQEELAQIFGA